MDKFYRKLSIITLLVGILFWFLRISWPVQAQVQSPNYLHTDGSRILDSNNNQVILTGINWFGLETENFAPHGLWARNLDSILDQIVELGFNTIRLPYSNQLLDPSSTPNGINFDLNPDLKDLNGLEIMDKVITEAGKRGLKVILDRHRPDSHAQSELWYTSQYDERRWISDWVMLAKRYSGNDIVIGMDLHNEPHGPATWGSDDSATDWRLAAERAGNAILEANPNLLIIVQGVEQYQGDWYWWGGNLLGVREQPVRLNVPNRLIYSTHVYGPGVYPQAWFSAPDFPENMPAIWDSHWGYLEKENIAPVVVGEFGGRSVGDDKEGIWQRALVSYIRENNISYFYWTLNPNSGDTGGILLDDWKSVDPEKRKLLSGYQFPLIGIEQVGTEPAARLDTPTPQVAEALRASPTSQVTETLPASPMPQVVGTLHVRYRNANQAENAQDSKPEFIISNQGSTPVSLDTVELFYWFTDDPKQPYVYHCDWAKIGCANVLGDFETSSSGKRYLRLHFLTGLEPLQPGQDSGEIKVRFNHADWSAYNQADDYSFSPIGDYQDWERVTLLVDGKVVWGGGPDSILASGPPETDTSFPTIPSPITPAMTATPQSTINTESILPESTLPSKTPMPQAIDPNHAPDQAWKMWTAGALAALATFSIGFLAAVIWLKRKHH
jgi:endoglucanase